MKKLIITLLLISSIGFSQVGINTTTPTKMLDVNGELRVRSLTKGTTESTALGETYTAPYRILGMAVILKNGSVSKSFGLTATRINNNLYRVAFNTNEADNDYMVLISGRSRNLSYDNTTTNSFDIIIDGNSSTGSNFDFNVVVYRIEN